MFKTKQMGYLVSLKQKQIGMASELGCLFENTLCLFITGAC